MLTGHSIVYFSPGPWNDLWRNRHQLMSLLSRHNKVLYVERRPYLRSTLHAFARRELTLKDLLRTPLLHVSENLYVFRYPLWAPICGLLGLRSLTRAIRLVLLNRTLHRLGFDRPIVWYSQPGMLDLLDAIPAPSLRVYHVVDEYASYLHHTPHTEQRTQARERQMLARVDAVIVVSQALYRAKRPYNPHTYLVPNAVDYALYQAALANPALPADIARIPPPRLGYTGLIGDKLDLSALLQTAQIHPEWSFVFLGHVRLSAQREIWRKLAALPNVHHLGPVTPDRVPHYLKAFQVGLMPYRQNRYTEYIDPLKLYDYLAVGLPVVSTDIPAVHPFGPHVQIATDAHHLDRAIQLALASAAPEQCQARMHLASLNRWEARVEQISELLQARLATIASNERLF